MTEEDEPDRDPPREAAQIRAHNPRLERLYRTRRLLRQRLRQLRAQGERADGAELSETRAALVTTERRIDLLRADPAATSGEDDADEEEARVAGDDHSSGDMPA